MLDGGGWGVRMAGPRMLQARQTTRRLLGWSGPPSALAMMWPTCRQVSQPRGLHLRWTVVLQCAQVLPSRAMTCWRTRFHCAVQVPGPLPHPVPVMVVGWRFVYVGLVVVLVPGSWRIR